MEIKSFGSSKQRPASIFSFKTWKCVNLGNVSTDDITSLETLRRGLRGDTVGKI